MLRSILIYLSQAAWMRRLMMGWKLARRVALRFVAGETLDQAVAAVQALNLQGMYATLDMLGEHTENASQASETTHGIINILDTIHSTGIQSALSIKLTQIGLSLDESLCEENLLRILKSAAEKDIFVRIDMEDSGCVDATIRLYWKMRRKHGLKNVGMVIQSCLYRSEKDTADLLAEDTRIRLVKGAYKEPSEIAYPKKADVDAAFDRLSKMTLDHAVSPDSPAISDDGRWPPVTAIGSHDEARINYAVAYAQKVGVPKEKVEVQMLHGIRRELQQKLAAQGYPVRIYVPFGQEWYPYFMRRLAERPANLWFFIGNFFKK